MVADADIDQVTRDDLNRIGRQMLDSKAAVAAIGSLKKMPSFSDIEIGLLDKEVVCFICHFLMYVSSGRLAKQTEIQPVQMMRSSLPQCNSPSLVPGQSTTPPQTPPGRSCIYWVASNMDLPGVSIKYTCFKQQIQPVE